MVDETVEQDAKQNVEQGAESDKAPRFPETWDELKQSDRLMNDLPDMVQPREFTPVQSVMFGTVVDIADEAVKTLTDTGEKKPRRRKGVQNTNSTAVADAVVAADSFFRQIAKDESKYDEWSRGRSATALFAMYMLLVRFYERELGKSNISRANTSDAESA